MTDYKELCAELADSIELLLEMRPVKAKPLQITEDRLARARTALAEPEQDRQSSLDDTHYEWELQDDEGEWQAGGSANNFEDVQREGMRYLQTYAQDGFHRLIIRQHCTRVIQEINNG